MPAYNGARFIAEAIESVRASTFRDFELLVLDDGSTDDTLKIIEQQIAQDARVRCVQLAHGGVAKARNAALREAQGEFIANLDADDATFPERFARQVAFLDAHPDCIAVGGRALVVDAKGAPVGVVIRVFSHDEIDAWHMEGRGGGLGNPMAMFRKQAALDIGGYTTSTEQTGEDYDLWLRLAEKGRLENLRDVLIRYRVHSDNVSTQSADQTHRLAVTHEILKQAFTRRGITDRTARRIEAPALSSAEKLCDEALVLYFKGRRREALLRALTACVHNPTAAGTRHTLRTVLAGAPPAWKTPSTPL